MKTLSFLLSYQEMVLGIVSIPDKYIYSFFVECIMFDPSSRENERIYIATIPPKETCLLQLYDFPEIPFHLRLGVNPKWPLTILLELDKEDVYTIIREREQLPTEALNMIKEKYTFCNIIIL